MRKLWPCGPTHLHLGALLLYDMLRAAAGGGSGCFEACGAGWSARLQRGEGGGVAAWEGKCLCAAGGCCRGEGRAAAASAQSWKLFARRDDEPFSVMVY
jgi:hypothetical protein